MSEAHYYRTRRAFEGGQSSWDNACPPDDDESDQAEVICSWCDGTGLDGIPRGEGLIPRCQPCNGTGVQR